MCWGEKIDYVTGEVLASHVLVDVEWLLPENANVPLWVADSTGRCNGLMKSLSRCVEV